MNAFMIIRIVLVIAMLAILCVMQILRFRNAKGEPGFDERQRLMQGRAYRDAFYTVLVVLAIYAGLNAMDKTGTVPVWFVVGSIIVLGMGIYLTECNLLDSGLRPKEDVQSTIGGWAGITLVNIINQVSIMMLSENNNRGSWRFFSLFLMEISVLCIVLIIVNFIKGLKNNNKELQ